MISGELNMEAIGLWYTKRKADKNNKDRGS
jgi:hypothetical protein